MEKPVKKARASKIYDVILVVALIVYIMVDCYIMPKGDTIPLWYHIFDYGWYVICAIIGFLEGRSLAYNTNITLEKTFKNEEEVREYHNSSCFGKSNDKKIVIFLILAIIFIGLTVVLSVVDSGKILTIIGTISEFVAIITVILFAYALGEKGGALKALRTKMK